MTHKKTKLIIKIITLFKQQDVSLLKNSIKISFQFLNVNDLFKFYIFNFKNYKIFFGKNGKLIIFNHKFQN